MAIYSYTFSPTGTSAKVMRGILEGINEILKTDITPENLTKQPLKECDFSDDDIVIVAAPVYGGKISPLIKQRLEAIDGCGAKAILVAVYGNRAFEGALTDLAAFMSDHGFHVCGAGAFVGEHSYSTSTMPIAEGRPDREDLKDANRFGYEIAEKILSGDLKEIDVAEMKDQPSPEQSMLNFRNFVMEYQKRQKESPVSYLPEVDKDICDGCGICYTACPTAAIAEDKEGVDAGKCIKCCACVKICPQNARRLFTPFAKPLSENFSQRKSPEWMI